MPTSANAPLATFAEGEGPQPGDLVVCFPPLFDTAEEAALSVEEYRKGTCSGTEAPAAALPLRRDLGRADPLRTPGNTTGDDGPDEEPPFPVGEFGLSSGGTTLFRLRLDPSKAEKWRIASNAERDRWRQQFRAFCQLQLAAIEKKLANDDEGAN
jgi:hypothetical protein